MASSTELSELPRRELVRLLCESRDQLELRDRKLRDLVHAYKRLQKEKEAIAQSLVVVDNDEDNEGKEESGKKGGESVSKLRQALATVAEEKSRFEASFAEEKRKRIKDNKEKDEALQSLNSELESLRSSHKLSVEELKSKLIVATHTQQKESGENALQIRKLRAALEDEQQRREDVSKSLEQAQQRLKELESISAEKCTLSSQISSLEQQLIAKEGEMRELESKLSETPAALKETQDALREAEARLSFTLDNHEKERKEKETTIADMRDRHEQRCRNMENRLQDLSATVGSYDRMKQHDTNVILQLREQIAELKDSQSKSKIRLDSRRDQEVQVECSDIGDDSEVISRLRQIWTGSEGPSQSLKKEVFEIVNFQELMDSGKVSNSKEAEQIQDKLVENNKKSDGSFDDDKNLPEADQELIASLRMEISELRASNERLISELSSTEDRLASRERTLQQELKTTRKSCKERLQQMENEFRLKKMQLEDEVGKQRQRCIQIMEEKEDEVRMVKSGMEQALNAAFTHNTTNNDSRKSASASPPPLGSSSSPFDESRVMVLHYTQELSLRDAELAQLRRQLYDTESAMRELQLSFVAKEQRSADRIEVLENTVRDLQRFVNKEENKDLRGTLEYLKNVVLSYMLTKEASSKEPMLKAIGAVLLFSNKEIRRVNEFNANTWQAWKGGTS